MANIDSPFGLKPVGHLNGNPWNGQTKKFLIEDDDSNAYFIGDPVVVEGEAGADDTTGIYPTIVIATDTTSHPLYGVITSFDTIGPTGLRQETPYNPAYTSRYANVCVDPDVIFIVQDDEATTALTGDVIGNNALLESATSGSTYTGLSGWELDASSVGTTSTDTVLILNAYPVHNNTIGLIHCIWEVIISNHMLRCQALTTGV